MFGGVVIFVDKTLRGLKAVLSSSGAGDEFELPGNLETAKALGIAIPHSFSAPRRTRPSRKVPGVTLLWCSATGGRCQVAAVDDEGSSRNFHVHLVCTRGVGFCRGLRGSTGGNARIRGAEGLRRTTSKGGWATDEVTRRKIIKDAGAGGVAAAAASIAGPRSARYRRPRSNGGRRRAGQYRSTRSHGPCETFATDLFRGDRRQCVRVQNRPPARSCPRRKCSRPRKPAWSKWVLAPRSTRTSAQLPDRGAKRSALTPFGLYARMQEPLWSDDGDGEKLIDYFGKKFNMYRLLMGKTARADGRSGWKGSNSRSRGTLKRPRRCASAGWAGSPGEAWRRCAARSRRRDPTRRWRSAPATLTEWVGLYGRRDAPPLEGGEIHSLFPAGGRADDGHLLTYWAKLNEAAQRAIKAHLSRRSAGFANVRRTRRERTYETAGAQAPGRGAERRVRPLWQSILEAA